MNRQRLADVLPMTERALVELEGFDPERQELAPEVREQVLRRLERLHEQWGRLPVATPAGPVLPGFEEL